MNWEGNSTASHSIPRIPATRPSSCLVSICWSAWPNSWKTVSNYKNNHYFITVEDKNIQNCCIQCPTQNFPDFLSIKKFRAFLIVDYINFKKKNTHWHSTSRRIGLVTSNSTSLGLAILACIPQTKPVRTSIGKVFMKILFKFGHVLIGYQGLHINQSTLTHAEPELIKSLQPLDGWTLISASQSERGIHNTSLDLWNTRSVIYIIKLSYSSDTGESEMMGLISSSKNMMGLKSRHIPFPFPLNHPLNPLTFAPLVITLAFGHGQ